MSFCRLTPIVLVLVAMLGSLAGARGQPFDAKETPLFTWRARVTSIAGQKPSAQKFTYTFGKAGEKIESAGDQWSDWGKFDLELAQKITAKGTYPNSYINGFPVVAHLTVTGVVDPTVVEVEAKLEGTDQSVTTSGELFGPTLGFLLWREADHSPHVATMAEYNRRYWKFLDGVQLKQPIQKFPIIDRFIGGDSDRRSYEEAYGTLFKAGFTGMMLDPNKMLHEIARKYGSGNAAWAVYNPPSYFAYDAVAAPDAADAWAKKTFGDPYKNAGFEPTEMKLFTLADEPGWYYPDAFKPVLASPTALQQFHDYLIGQKLTPADVGAKEWSEVKPLGRSGAKDLPSKRLFYWTMRFFAWNSEISFANATRAIEKSFYPNMPIFTNWNFFSGRLYVPGPVANNSAKTNPDAAMGGHDWLEFGRLRGGTMLWTEDWFGDELAYQWSFYASKLRSAAELAPAGSGVEFGGFVIPRTAGSREDGILQKILTIVGSGGKAIEYFVFGPEYDFPGNCYSENAKVLPKMAEAHRMIGAAESLLWPGRRVKPRVAILMPRSAEMWDAKDIPITTEIEDATNNNLNRKTVDYMAEVYDIYLALQHANVPCSFLDEDDLTQDGLKKYQVVYVTEPNVPAEGQQALVDWIKAGGTVVTVSGAAQADRYDEPCNVLGQATGITQKPRERILIRDISQLQPVAHGDGELGKFTAYGVRGVASGDAKVGAKFDDGSPAILRSAVGKGQRFHFNFMPGLSYAALGNSAIKDRLPVGWPEPLRKWIDYPTVFARVQNPVIVDHALVETPMLISGGGAVVTILNWTGEPIKKLKLDAIVPFTAKSVVSVKQGTMKFKTTDDGIECTLPVGAADILMIRP